MVEELIWLFSLASGRILPGQGLTHLFPGGRGLCNARGLRFRVP